MSGNGTVEEWQKNNSVTHKLNTTPD